MPGVVVEPSGGTDGKGKVSKNAQRRAKKKEQKQQEREASATPAPETLHANEANAVRPIKSSSSDSIQDVAAIENDYIGIDVADDSLPLDDPLYQQFADIFAKFQEEDQSDPVLNEPEKPEVFYDSDDNIQGEDEEEATQKRLSKKARKAANKLSIAELKAIVRKPEAVEWFDTSAHDPKLLVSIKSARNVVPVPNHWSLKREYLSSKRGIEKPAFSLPKFIAETGISEMRDSVLEKQAEASLKQRQRERVQPKMGKLDIDYTKLYEAFFRRQTKPSLTRYGEVYYEGKEYETNLRHLRPGELSEELQESLNMPPGAPPPWLINMQKFGPPPSYPALKIAGLNAPPPIGASWGFHPGGYGKPPVDDSNKPLWGGDIINQPNYQEGKEKDDGPVIDHTLWGELQALPESEDEEEEGDEDDDEEGDEEGGKEEADSETVFGGMETPSGITSTVPTDFGTQSMAEEFDLRKRRRGTETEESHHPRAAGQVLQERSIRAEGFFGGQHAYNLNNTRTAPANVPVLGSRDQEAGRKRKAGDLDVSVDIDALGRDDKLSKEEVKRQYEAQKKQEGVGGWKGVVDQEDLSQMIAEESAKRQKRDQERQKRR